ncbi:hypothetical protein ACFUCV_10905 [Specibacter sp. NPDC057265]|uniref:hypothetical protein n=1 Tax=Specibacter sp. NPDC057265 TaxID=3346075 RepID=UPI0036412CD5
MGFNPGAEPRSSSGDDEQTWRELVARLEAADQGGTGQEGEGTAPPSAAASPPGFDAGAAPKGVADFDPLGVWQQHGDPAPRELSAHSRSNAAGPGPRDHEPAEGDDERFVPAEPPRLSNADPAVLLSWFGAAGGPLFLVFAAMFWRSIPLLVTIAVIMAFLSGTGYLLSRLPKHRDHDGGDGAVV